MTVAEDEGMRHLGNGCAMGDNQINRLVVATRFRDRLRGFLVPRPTDCVLLISPCDSIHTFGMKSALDIAFFDEEGVILRSKRSLASGRVVRCKGAMGVLERVSDTCGRWYREGEKVMLYVWKND